MSVETSLIKLVTKVADQEEQILAHKTEINIQQSTINRLYTKIAEQEQHLQAMQFGSELSKFESLRNLETISKLSAEVQTLSAALKLHNASKVPLSFNTASIFKANNNKNTESAASPASESDSTNTPSSLT